MIDRTQIVYEILTGASELATTIGTNCWSPVAPPSWDGDTPAVIFHQESGSSHTTGATNKASFVFKCYGGNNSYGSSRELFTQLYERLQMQDFSVASGDVDLVVMTNDSQLPPEPDENYKAHLAVFSFTFRA